MDFTLSFSLAYKTIPSIISASPDRIFTKD